MDKELRLKALEDLARLDEELGLLDKNWPEDQLIDGLKLVCTSIACPEQYEVFDAEGKQVGYLRLRHGRFRADYPDCGGETVYASNTKGDGTFSEDEREGELRKAVEVIRKKLGICLMFAVLFCSCSYKSDRNYVIVDNYGQVVDEMDDREWAFDKAEKMTLLGRVIPSKPQYFVLEAKR